MPLEIEYSPEPPPIIPPITAPATITLDILLITPVYD
nr:MAG TPA: hypothetical protein [Caudoviricetes sp.]